MSKSKQLAYILRHRPEKFNIKLTKEGWANIPDILIAINISKLELVDLVNNDNKQRYAIKGNQIRANQGHSIPVKLNFKIDNNISKLYHGTAISNKTKILKQGLKPMNRNFVHLSKDIETANIVGKRHGKPIIFEIDAQTMIKKGFNFKISENKVYLIEEHIPSKYLSLL